MIQAWSAGLLDVFDVRLVAPTESASGAGGVLYVANHVSWLDIPAIHTLTPCRFVAKADVARWPLVGFLARSVGTYFLDRTSARSMGGLAKEAARALAEGQSLGFFPEGTTTDGSLVLPFKSGFFQAAVDARATIQPMALRYQLEGGAPATSAPFVGDMSLARSIWNMLASPPVVLKVAYGPPMKGTSISRKELGRAAFRSVAELLRQQQAATPDVAPARRIGLQTAPSCHDAPWPEASEIAWP